MGREGVRGYVGVCKVHRAELQRLRRAPARGGGRGTAGVRRARALPHVLRPRIRAQRGRGGASTASVTSTPPRRRSPGRTSTGSTRSRAWRWCCSRAARSAAASRAIARSLAADDAGPEGRRRSCGAGCLPAQVEIALAAGDLDTARQPRGRAGPDRRRPPQRGLGRGRAHRQGRRAAPRGRGTPGAIALLDPAWRGWQEADVPYEAARARQLLGRPTRSTVTTSRRGSSGAPRDRCSSDWVRSATSTRSPSCSARRRQATGVGESPARSCSPTSSARPTSCRSWATRTGRTAARGTTRRCGRRSRSTTATWSATPATGSSSRSTTPGRAIDAQRSLASSARSPTNARDHGFARGAHRAAHRRGDRGRRRLSGQRSARRRAHRRARRTGRDPGVRRDRRSRPLGARFRRRRRASRAQGCAEAAGAVHTIDWR
jgi:hypothetical protein